MTESSDSSSAQLRQPPADPRKRRRRCLPIFCIACLVLVLLLFVIALTLALTLFKPRDPTTQLVSARVSGVSPRVSVPAVQIQINVTLDLDILVHNPNRASFTHGHARTLLYYRGAQVGDADVKPGRIPARGSAHVSVAMTVQADRFAADLGSLIGDVLAGEVGLDASTRIPGRVKFLGFVTHHAVAVSQCHVAIGFPDLKVRRQECRQKTKL